MDIAGGPSARIAKSRIGLKKATLARHTKAESTSTRMGNRHEVTSHHLRCCASRSVLPRLVTRSTPAAQKTTNRGGGPRRAFGCAQSLRLESAPRAISRRFPDELARRRDRKRSRGGRQSVRRVLQRSEGRRAERHY